MPDKAEGGLSAWATVTMDSIKKDKITFFILRQPLLR